MTPTLPFEVGRARRKSMAPGVATPVVSDAAAGAHLRRDIGLAAARAAVEVGREVR
jgi:hypothetical protein